MAARKRLKAPKMEKPRTIPQLALETDRPRRTLFRQLVALHKQDVENGEGGWLFRLGTKKYFINLSRLRHAHPALFESWYVERDEFDDLAERVKRAESNLQEVGKRERSTAAKARDANAGVADLTPRVARLEQKKSA